MTFSGREGHFKYETFFGGETKNDNKYQVRKHWITIDYLTAKSSLIVNESSQHNQFVKVTLNTRDIQIQ